MKKLFYSTPVKFTWMIGLLSVFFVTECVAQQPNDFTYKPVPVNLLPSASILASLHQKADAVAQGAYDLTSALPSGYVKDGSVDYTSYLQQALRSHPKVVFPDFPVMISPKGLILVSNSILIFKPSSKLIIQPSNLPHYNALMLYNVNNVAIYFPVIEGDRKAHSGTGGEWGHGINISGSTNIQVINPKVADCWGDGIYIGKTSSRGCQNIYICYAELDYNRRNGISIVSVDSLNLVHPVISNTNGTRPMAGIDIEPNDNTDVLKNINIDSPVTFNSYMGISVELIGIPGVSDKNVGITINGHLDEQSYFPFGVGMFPKSKDASNVSGNIKIVNPIWKDNKKPLYYAGEFNHTGPMIEFRHVQIVRGKNVHPEDLDKVKNTLAEKDKIAFH